MADINEFINQYMPAAMKAAAQLGTDPAHVLGQWGLETGWGKSVIPGTNNLGNVKAVNGQAGRKSKLIFCGGPQPIIAGSANMA